jgi:dipeptidyl-peptidase-4
MKMSMNLCKLFALILLVAVPKSSYSQVTKEDYARAERFLSFNVENKLVFKKKVEPHWLKNTDRFWYCNYTRGGKEYVFVDCVRNILKPAFDHVKMAAAVSSASGRLYLPNDLPLEHVEFVEKGRMIHFDVNSKRWACDLEEYRCTKTKDRLERGILSPDGQWIAFNRKYNLYIRSIASGKEIQLTADGEPNHYYAEPASPSAGAITARLTRRRMPLSILWSPDSKKILTQKLDQRKVDKMHLIQSTSQDIIRPILHSYRCALAGDKNVPRAELVIFDIEKMERVDVSLDSLITFWSPINEKMVWWNEDSNQIYIIEEKRASKILRLCMADTRTGAVRKILEEQGSTYVQLNLMYSEPPNVRILSGGSEVIWFSERDGWGHLYLYNGNTGAIKKQITSGPWVVRDIMHVDEKGRWIYFTGGGREEGRDPYYRHLYRIKMDGSKLELLTPEDADHLISFSPSGRYFTDTYSRVDAVPISVLRACDGMFIRELERADIDLLLETGWKWPEPFRVKGRDGTTGIYGVIFRPSTFDPEKKYPIIDNIYPGPHNIRCAKSFAGMNWYWHDPSEYWHCHAIAELGFIVVTIDGMGTAFRSKAFHDVSYRNLGSAGGIEDHIAGIKQLAGRYPYINLDRVGIYGHSGGGYASARAILAYPDFYKVAVSSAGNHDPRLEKAAWVERWMGLPIEDAYERQTNMNIASNLKGKLLLIHGDLDDNVSPALTLALAYALIEANKDFDMLLMANRNHRFMDLSSPKAEEWDLYFIRKRWDYFVRHLLGVEPPQEYRIRKPE